MIVPLKNKNDSCYIDVALLSLFRSPCPLIRRSIIREQYDCIQDNVCGGSESRCHVEELQREIKRIAIDLSKGKKTNIDCLREKLVNCPKLNETERFDKVGMNDPSVFIEFLFSLFPCLKEAVEMQKRFQCPDCKEKVQLYTHVPPLKYLVTGPLENIHGTELSSLINEQKHDFSDVPFIIFDLTRVDDRGDFVDDVVVYPEKKLRLGKSLVWLTSIVVWLDFHYTCYTLIKNEWYHFDDTKKKAFIVGDYDDLLSCKRGGSPLTNAKWFVYQKKR